MFSAVFAADCLADRGILERRVPAEMSLNIRLCFASSENAQYAAAIAGFAIVRIAVIPAFILHRLAYVSNDIQGRVSWLLVLGAYLSIRVHQDIVVHFVQMRILPILPQSTAQIQRYRCQGFSRGAKSSFYFRLLLELVEARYLTDNLVAGFTPRTVID